MAMGDLDRGAARALPHQHGHRRSRLRWLEHLGIIGPPPNRVVQTVYAPLIWLLENSPKAEKAAKSTEKTLEPIAPKP
jgi:hypothetical protein